MVEDDRLAEMEELIHELSGLRAAMLKLEGDLADEAAAVHRAHRRSARNLAHYLALRQRDLRPLQERLAALGLSSLGRAESYTLASVEAVLSLLYRLVGRPADVPADGTAEVGFDEGKALLDMRTEALLGPQPASRGVRIMVTVPGAAAHDYHLVRELLASGMNLMRINCAHDDPDTWLRIIGHLERARQELDRDCRVLMDLAGPKLRTGPIEPGPQVIKWRPHRDDFGHVIAPARIWLTAAEKPDPSPLTADACLSVSGDWLARLKPGMTIKFFDARSSSRTMKVVAEAGKSRWAESLQTTYVHSDTTLYVNRSHLSGSTSRLFNRAKVAKLPTRPQFITLKPGDTLILTRALEPGRPAIYDDGGRLLSPATIGITLPEVFSDVCPGEAVWLDDGKIGGFIRSSDESRIEVEITHARPTGEKLMADKGINLPDSELHLPALTAKDIADLPFIARHADLVGYSFVRQETDVYDLQSHLRELDAKRLGIVLKIETRRAFERLPNLMLAAMRSPATGVMIARGDLAVECGYQRLAEVQEEILWIAEAAHMPVIWATQVLERLAKDGLPSRAEITDAAMGERAECVMLNKGPYIVSAVRVLDDILRRMQTHQSKKSSRLRQLNLAAQLFQLRS